MRRPGARREYLGRFTRPELRAYAAEIARFWRAHYGEAISPVDHLRFTAATGVHDVGLLPGRIWWNEVLPRFNDPALLPAFDDKRLVQRLLGDGVGPPMVVKRVRGAYYDRDDSPLDRSSAWELVARAAHEGELIAKPAATNNGLGVVGLRESEGRLALAGGGAIAPGELERRLGADLLVQERIAQHRELEAVHPSSVNTLRVVTFRWDGEIHHLGTFARFGAGGAVTDNSSTGGLFVGVDAGGGRVHESAWSKGRARHVRHPDSGVAFAELRIPGWPAPVELAVGLHGKVVELDLISWDIAVGPEAQPVFVELNTRGAGELYQLAFEHSMFGQLTAPVLASLR